MERENKISRFKYTIGVSYYSCLPNITPAHLSGFKVGRLGGGVNRFICRFNPPPPSTPASPSIIDIFVSILWCNQAVCMDRKPNLTQGPTQDTLFLGTQGFIKFSHTNVQQDERRRDEGIYPRGRKPEGFLKIECSYYGE